MSLFTPIKKQELEKVPNSDYIKTENKPDEEVAKPADPATPDTTETK
jgi:hypothetical protein